MADRGGSGTATKEAEKKVPSRGPTSKEAFRKVEEEQRARLARQRKAEEEWLQKVIQKEEDRRKRIQRIIAKEEEQKSVLRAHAEKKAMDDARRNLVKNLEAEHRHRRAEQIKRIKAVQRKQLLDRIAEETECASGRRQGANQ